MSAFLLGSYLFMTCRNQEQLVLELPFTGREWAASHRMRAPPGSSSRQVSTESYCIPSGILSNKDRACSGGEETTTPRKSAERTSWLLWGKYSRAMWHSGLWRTGRELGWHRSDRQADKPQREGSWCVLGAGRIHVLVNMSEKSGQGSKWPEESCFCFCFFWA